MPVMDGLEAIRRIREEPGGGDTRIVVLTASAMEHDRARASESGADEFVAKPCREREILEKMGELLKIEYEYEEIHEAGTPSAGEGVRAEQLRLLPVQLIEELRTATSKGQRKRLGELIVDAGATVDAGTAHALQGLADHYEYDILTRLLEEACRR